MYCHHDMQFEDEMEWSKNKKKKNTPYVHIWMKFGKMRAIYQSSGKGPGVAARELKNEDMERWVEVPDDYLNCKLMSSFDLKEQKIIVIEKKQKQKPYWPRAKGCDWRHTLQIGDIIDVKDSHNEWYEAVIVYIYPKDSDKAGQCIVHYIGWKTKWDEILSISDEDRLAKRHIHTKGPYRKGKK